LGRLAKEKGPEPAIRIAKAANQELRMAAKIPRNQTGYYREQLRPLIDNEQIRLVGELDDKSKGEVLAGAMALLFPIDWPEPFGLVMIEAMACGTPVVAFRHGSVPEIIDEGVTGFVVDSEAEAVAALSRVGSLDRTKVRAQFEKRFSARRMAEDYVRIYETIAGKPARSALKTAVASEPMVTGLPT
jgi:glycosyltransferase involved in cell wall biosynthesis